jgi:branched-chain amino acid transport system permease protein
VPVGVLTFRLKGGYFAVGSWLVSEAFQLSVGNSAYLGHAAVVAGLGTVEGPLVGAAVYVVLQDLLGATGEVPLIVLCAVSVIVMLAAPHGIAGFARDRFGWTLFPVARRPPRGAGTGCRTA